MTFSEKDRVKIREAARIIESDLRYHYTIGELADRVLMGSSKMREAFKLEYGVGPYEYLVHKRIEKACELLLANDPIPFIALSVGFTGSTAVTNFIRFFKKEMGETPHVWRKTELRKRSSS